MDGITVPSTVQVTFAFLSFHPKRSSLFSGISLASSTVADNIIILFFYIIITLLYLFNWQILTL